MFADVTVMGTPANITQKQSHKTIGPLTHALIRILTSDPFSPRKPSADRNEHRCRHNDETDSEDC